MLFVFLHFFLVLCVRSHNKYIAEPMSDVRAKEQGQVTRMSSLR